MKSQTANIIILTAMLVIPHESTGQDLDSSGHKVATTKIESSGLAMGHPYLALVRRLISAQWTAPQYNVDRYPLQSVVTFRLSKSGKVTGLALEEESGNDYYDLSALRAVRTAILPSFSSDMAQPYIDARFVFSVRELSKAEFEKIEAEKADLEKRARQDEAEKQAKRDAELQALTDKQNEDERRLQRQWQEEEAARLRLVNDFRAGELFAPRAGSIWCTESNKKVGIVASGRMNKKGFQSISYEDLEVGAPIDSLLQEEKLGMFKKFNGQTMVVIAGPHPLTGVYGINSPNRITLCQ